MNLKPITQAAAGIAMALLLCTNVQCKKEKKTKTELLTEGQWHITAFTSNPAIDYDDDGVESTDVFGQFEACEKDNYFVFKTNNTYDVNEGPSKCDPLDNQIETDVWTFTESETKIEIAGDSYVIEELSKNTLRLKYTDQDYTETVTFSK